MNSIKTPDNVWHKIESTSANLKMPKLKIATTACGLSLGYVGDNAAPADAVVCEKCKK
jgi:hypothetical protein